MNIELVDPIPELKKEYLRQVERFIKLKIITLEEWNTKFKNYRDNFGYSIISYIIFSIDNTGNFITENPIMIEHREELEKRFKIKILTLNEYMRKTR